MQEDCFEQIGVQVCQLQVAGSSYYPDRLLASDSRAGLGFMKPPGGGLSWQQSAQFLHRGVGGITRRRKIRQVYAGLYTVYIYCIHTHTYLHTHIYIYRYVPMCCDMGSPKCFWRNMPGEAAEQ